MTEEGQLIEKIDFVTTPPGAEYYECTFSSCNFSGLQLQDVRFENCEFAHCNLSLSKLLCNFDAVTFEECKLTGADFSNICSFSGSFSFRNSLMDYVSFVGLKMRHIKFFRCNLNEAYFDEADITSSVFDECDLLRTSFNKTNLEKVDFSTSFNYTIDPNVNKLKKTVFSEDGLRGLVAHLNIIIR